MDWEGEIREVKFPLTFVKEMNLSPTHGFRSVREECLLEEHQKIEIDMNWALLVKHRFKNSIKVARH
jgi:xylose isomerase